jgi:pyruvate carboxylase
LHLCIITTDDCPSDNAIYDFSKKAVENGLDIFRVFDSLNYFGTFRWFVCHHIDRQCIGVS